MHILLHINLQTIERILALYTPNGSSTKGNVIFDFRNACEHRLASYSSEHAHRSLSRTTLPVYTNVLHTKLLLYYSRRSFSTVELHAIAPRLESYISIHASSIAFSYTTFAHNLQRSTNQTTSLLKQTFLFHCKTPCLVRLASYVSNKHASLSLISRTTFMHADTSGD